MNRARRAFRVITALSVVFLAMLHFPASPAGRGSDEDYRAIFGDKYAEAEKYIEENPWIAESLRLPPEETAVALAVVFPEILRFSDLEDLIQIRALKVLYVPYGREYADFSVGHFQMKPSFIEHLEADWNRLTSAEEKSDAGIPAFVMRNASDPRMDRILRLDDERWQVKYLRVFMAIMKKRYGKVEFLNVEDRLRFYATAYNAGFAAGEAKLRSAMREKRFHLELYSPKRTYSYADVAVFFFRRSRPR
jgi:hypothetical protein